MSTSIFLGNIVHVYTCSIPCIKLDVKVEDIKEEDIVYSIINNCDDGSGGHFSNVNNNYNIPEFVLRSIEEYLDLLKKENQILREELSKLKNTN